MIRAVEQPGTVVENVATVGIFITLTVVTARGGSGNHAAIALRLRAYAALLAVLTLVFALRVAAQAVQRWMPQSFLPPFEDFQGSNLPYGVLLFSQLVILAAMVYYTWRLRAGTLTPERAAGIVLAWLGGVYMSVALGRIAIGLVVSDAAAWFTAWIPAVLHVALALFVVTLAYYHVAESRPR